MVLALNDFSKADADPRVGWMTVQGHEATVDGKRRKFDEGQLLRAMTERSTDERRPREVELSVRQ